MDYANSRLHATAHEILHGPDKDKAKKSMDEYLDVIENALAGREYLAGGYSLADITFLPFFVRRRRYQVEIERLPGIQRWVERMLERPAVKTTL
ncbi:MAG TPA: glutathione binding-like protein [Candidatus Binatia bacterium]